MALEGASNNSEPQSIEITDGQCRLTLDVQRREYPQAQAYWDVYGMVTHLQAIAPGFRADFTTSFHLSELVALRE